MIDRLKEVLKDKKRRESLKKRFWSKVNIKGEHECWEWIAKSRADYGYGVINAGRGNGTFKSNRVAYYLSKGDIPDNLLVLHSCDNPSCCNPSHLRLGTNKDNTRDAIDRNRLKNPPIFFGEKHHNTKFTSQDVTDIISDNRSYAKIATDYGVSDMTIYRIKNGKTWKNHEDIRKRANIS